MSNFVCELCVGRDQLTSSTSGGTRQLSRHVSPQWCSPNKVPNFYNSEEGILLSSPLNTHCFLENTTIK